MSSFKVEAKGDTDRLSPEELKGLVNKPELLSVTERHTPSQAVAFWLLETELEKMELELGTEIRLKTRGDSPFIFSLAKLHAGTVTKCNFVGDGQAGASWTDNILANRPPGGPAPEPRGRGDGAEEDEWHQGWCRAWMGGFAPPGCSGCSLHWASPEEEVSMPSWPLYVLQCLSTKAFGVHIVLPGVSRIPVSPPHLHPALGGGCGTSDQACTSL
uniref:Arpin n=1 Tax=Chelonoidis abingdonii TaxID=106734 RepID=A0A8C0GXL5_CHEAB